KQSPRLRGVALVPLNNVPAAVKEVERAASIGLIGVMLAAHGHGKNLGEPEFHPLYATCERLNMPVGVHAAQMNCEGLNRFTSFIGVHAVSHPFEQMVCATGMILGGIPELFPRLRIAYLEAGCGWVPYWMWRLDEEYEKRTPEASLLKAKPSEYMRSGRIFYSCDPDEEMIDYVMDRLGEDVIFYASDYPHWDALYPNSVKVLMANKGLTDKRKKKILDDTCRRFYPALA
ncbi:MAG: amidohydrolase family protein, partial [Deltaproteobacteria bacterium]|nr:amidohydrolase family protein [Deltaproteobacteria bacterium]